MARQLISGSQNSAAASRPPRANAVKPRRTVSTFSRGTAYSGDDNGLEAQARRPT
jgi:hypothetical protein